MSILRSSGSSVSCVQDQGSRPEDANTVDGEDVVDAELVEG
jgi:hypothetical protein